MTNVYFVSYNAVYCALAVVNILHIGLNIQPSRTIKLLSTNELRHMLNGRDINSLQHDLIVNNARVVRSWK